MNVFELTTLVVIGTDYTGSHDITEILLRVALNIINPNAHIYMPEIGLLNDHDGPF
jgi:hypothetical protein